MTFTKKDTGPVFVQFFPRAFAAVGKRNTYLPFPGAYFQNKDDNF